MRKKEKTDGTRAFGKRTALIVICTMVIIAAASFIFMRLFNGEETVGFEPVKENQLPADITSDVIPSYKTLERALACMVDDDVYVIVTRGEKPTSGFGVSIDRMAIEEENGKTKLIVYAVFDDPQKETAISQIITYPLCVVKTDLKELPDAIELRIQY